MKKKQSLQPPPPPPLSTIAKEGIAFNQFENNVNKTFGSLKTNELVLKDFRNLNDLDFDDRFNPTDIQKYANFAGQYSDFLFDSNYQSQYRANLRFDEDQRAEAEENAKRMQRRGSSALPKPKAQKYNLPKKEFTPEDLQWISPKIVEMAREIYSQDELDMKTENKLFKHYIFTDVTSNAFGAKMILTALTVLLKLQPLYNCDPVYSESLSKFYMDRENKKTAAASASASADLLSELLAEEEEEEDEEEGDDDGDYNELKGGGERLERRNNKRQNQLIVSAAEKEQYMYGGARQRSTKVDEVLQELDKYRDAQKQPHWKELTLKQTPSTNHIAILSTGNLFGKAYREEFKKEINRIYNDANNVNGQYLRFIILDRTTKEGVDLYDVKYTHLFEAPANHAYRKQTIGRALRMCGQKRLEYKKDKGWTLHVNEYDIAIPDSIVEHLADCKSTNELYRVMNNGNSIRNIDEKIELVENHCIKLSIDYHLNKLLHQFPPNHAINHNPYFSLHPSFLSNPQYIWPEAVFTNKCPSDDQLIKEKEKTNADAVKQLLDAAIDADDEKEEGEEEEDLAVHSAQSAKQSGGEKEGAAAAAASAPIDLINFTATQQFVADYFSPSLQNKGLLLWHSVGSGKTCTAISTATNTAFRNAGYQVIWITKSALKKDIYKNIFSSKTCFHPLAEGGGGGQHLSSFLQAAKRNALLADNGWFLPITYRQFSNMLNGNSMNNRLELAQQTNTQFVRDQANNNGDLLYKKLIIIDEAHKLLYPEMSRQETPDINAIFSAIQHSYHVSGKNSCRLLLMTATPIIKEPMDMMKLLNFLIPANIRMNQTQLNSRIQANLEKVHVYESRRRRKKLARSAFELLRQFPMSTASDIPFINPHFTNSWDSFLDLYPIVPDDDDEDIIAINAALNNMEAAEEAADAEEVANIEGSRSIIVFKKAQTIQKGISQWHRQISGLVSYVNRQYDVTQFAQVLPTKIITASMFPEEAKEDVSTFPFRYDPELVKNAKSKALSDLFGEIALVKNEIDFLNQTYEPMIAKHFSNCNSDHQWQIKQQAQMYIKVQKKLLLDKLNELKKDKRQVRSVIDKFDVCFFDAEEVVDNKKRGRNKGRKEEDGEEATGEEGESEEDEEDEDDLEEQDIEKNVKNAMKTMYHRFHFSSNDTIVPETLHAPNNNIIKVLFHQDLKPNDIVCKCEKDTYLKNEYGILSVSKHGFPIIKKANQSKIDQRQFYRFTGSGGGNGSNGSKGAFLSVDERGEPVLIPKKFDRWLPTNGEVVVKEAIQRDHTPNDLSPDISEDLEQQQRLANQIEQEKQQKVLLIQQRAACKADKLKKWNVATNNCDDDLDAIQKADEKKAREDEREKEALRLRTLKINCETDKLKKWNRLTKTCDDDEVAIRREEENAKKEEEKKKHRNQLEEFKRKKDLCESEKHKKFNRLTNICEDDIDAIQKEQERELKAKCLTEKWKKWNAVTKTCENDEAAIRKETEKKQREKDKIIASCNKNPLKKWDTVSNSCIDNVVAIEEKRQKEENRKLEATNATQAKSNCLKNKTKKWNFETKTCEDDQLKIDQFAAKKAACASSKSATHIWDDVSMNCIEDIQRKNICLSHPTNTWNIKKGCVPAKAKSIAKTKKVIVQKAPRLPADPIQPSSSSSSSSSSAAAAPAAAAVAVAPANQPGRPVKCNIETHDWIPVSKTCAKKCKDGFIRLERRSEEEGLYNRCVNQDPRKRRTYDKRNIQGRNKSGILLAAQPPVAQQAQPPVAQQVQPAQPPAALPPQPPVAQPPQSAKVYRRPASSIARRRKITNAPTSIPAILPTPAPAPPKPTQPRRPTPAPAPTPLPAPPSPAPLRAQVIDLTTPPVDVAAVAPHRANIIDLTGGANINAEDNIQLTKNLKDSIILQKLQTVKNHLLLQKRTKKLNKLANTSIRNVHQQQQQPDELQPNTALCGDENAFELYQKSVLNKLLHFSGNFQNSKLDHEPHATAITNLLEENKRFKNTFPKRSKVLQANLNMQRAFINMKLLHNSRKSFKSRKLDETQPIVTEKLLLKKTNVLLRNQLSELRKSIKHHINDLKTKHAADAH